jgi:RecA-family ATPase
MPRDVGFKIINDQAAPPTPLSFVRPHKLQGVPVQQREWIVEDWLPAGAATLNYGDGGVGKTLLAQQLMTSCATGKPWCGLAVTRCRSLAIFCEDDEAEIHRRQDRINHAYGVEFDDLDDMTWASRVGKDNALMRFLSDGKPVLTEMLASMKKEAEMFQARLIVLDTAADMFGGNENDRSQVRNFVGALNAWAQHIKGAVLINAHPSRAGLSSAGDMDGGSTAWSNTARSRWSLTRPKAEAEDTTDTDARVLTRRKANYAAMGTELRLRWTEGVLMPQSRPTGFAAAAAGMDAEAGFLDLLVRCIEGNMPVSNSPHAHNFAPKVFAARPDRNGHTRRDFEGAMQRLLVAKKIRLENYGRKSDERRRIVLSEPVADD